MNNKTFKELEQSGWRDKAAAYDSIFALITRQAINPLLDSFGDLAGKRFLDVAVLTLSNKSDLPSEIMFSAIKYPSRVVMVTFGVQH